MICLNPQSMFINTGTNFKNNLYRTFVFQSVCSKKRKKVTRPLPGPTPHKQKKQYKQNKTTKNQKQKVNLEKRNKITKTNLSQFSYPCHTHGALPFPLRQASLSLLEAAAPSVQEVTPSEDEALAQGRVEEDGCLGRRFREKKHKNLCEKPENNILFIVCFYGVCCLGCLMVYMVSRCFSPLEWEKTKNNLKATVFEKTMFCCLILFDVFLEKP